MAGKSICHCQTARLIGCSQTAPEMWLWTGSIIDQQRACEHPIPVYVLYIYTSDNVLHYISLYIMYTYIWLVVWNMCYFSIYWECHHPNRRSPSFFRGVGEPPTRYICIQGLFLLMSRCDRLHHDPPPWSGCTRQAMDSGYPIIPTFHGSNAQTHGSTCLVVNCCPKIQKLWVILPLCPEMP